MSLKNVAGRDCDILQIAATYGSAEFSRYVWPSSKPIDPRAAAVHKITVDTDNKLMYVAGQRVDHVDRGRAMRDFAAFIEKVPGPGTLVAHNGDRFDFPRLKRAMDGEEVPMPANVVSELDTLRAFRSLWPGLKSYALQELVKEKLLREPDKDAHNATSDTRTLQELVAFVPPARHCILERHLKDLKDSQLNNVEESFSRLQLRDEDRK